MTVPPIFDLTRGTTPLLLSMPHSGTALPPNLRGRLTEQALTLPDTDWHVPRLYECAALLGASVLVANYSRYVIDLNRPPTNESLYPGQTTTELCPTTTFEGEPLYRARDAPNEAEVAERRRVYWEPYHAELRAVLDELRRRFGYALLYDCHSIRSMVPRLFVGTLPDLNLGTARGASAGESLSAALTAKLSEIRGYTSVVDGRFVGGHITRACGRPAEGIHAVQMELAQCNYMLEEPPYTFLPEKAALLGAALQTVLKALLRWRPS